MQSILFDNWDNIARTAILTILGYVTMVVLLRVSGKRTLSKLNAFDFVVTIALGSSLASVCISKNVTLAQGATCFGMLVLLQFCLSRASVSSRIFKNMITSQPALLFYKGDFLTRQMKRERITMEEILSAGRGKGFASLENVYMIVLETTGELTFVEPSSQHGKSTTSDVPGTSQHETKN